MRYVCLTAALFLGAIPTGLPAGEKSTYEDVVKEMLATMDQLTMTLSTIRDEETAKDAQPELRKAAGKWQAIKKKAEGLPPPSKEEKDRIAKQYKEKLEVAQKKMFGEVGRVRMVSGGREALLEISSVLDKKSKK
jgi:hypothetical protein